MVENKEESLARARERGVQLGLNNVWFYQSNMDYYQVKAGAQQCLIFTVEHGLLSGNSWSSTTSGFTRPTGLLSGNSWGSTMSNFASSTWTTIM
jgi:hypothetical protein